MKWYWWVLVLVVLILAWIPFSRGMALKAFKAGEEVGKQGMTSGGGGWWTWPGGIWAQSYYQGNIQGLTIHAQH